METIEKCWESYRDTVIPKDAPLIQIEECSRAFYAGCASIMVIVSLEEKEVSEDSSISVLSSLIKELKDYSEQFTVEHYGT